MKILLTGATDGIGLATAEKLVGKGHTILLHGRNREKLQQVANELGVENIELYVADLSDFDQVRKLADEIAERHDHLDVLINNAGVFYSSETETEQGLDIRFAVNTVAPYMLTKLLISLMNTSGRVINLSSAAQAPVNIEALKGFVKLSDREAYAQSKLALTMWTFEMAKYESPVLVAVNPKSLLGSKMVKEAFGIEGEDIHIGAEILCRAALSADFNNASGKYFDNDIGAFSDPHPDAVDHKKTSELIQVLDEIMMKS